MKFQENIQQRLTGRHKKSFNFVGSVKNKVILDIGCSFGWFERLAVENGCEKIVGIDTDEKSLISAKDQIKDKRAKFLKGSALDLSTFERNHFDKIVMWEVLEHLPKGSEEKAFQEMNRILKSGGRLYLSTPNKTFWSCTLDPAWWLIGHRHYNLKDYEKMAGKARLNIEKVEHRGGFYELTAMIILYLFKWVFKREMPFKDWFDRKRENEYLEKKKGFATIFLELKNDEK